MSGPAAVAFATPNVATSAVTLTAAGTYTLQLTVDDGVSASSATMHVVVNPAGSPQIWGQQIWGQTGSKAKRSKWGQTGSKAKYLEKIIESAVVTALLFDAAHQTGAIPQSISCIFTKTCDELQIAILRLLIAEFPDLQLPPPDDSNTQLAGPYAYNPKCKRWKCAVKCQVVDFSQGFDNARGYVTALGAGDTPEEACTQAERNGNDSFAPYQPGHRLRHCNPNTRKIWR